jgi:glutarate dioxygenase
MFQATSLDFKTVPNAEAAYVVKPHPVHARLRIVELAPVALEKFLAIADEIDVQNLEYVPFMRFALASTLADVAGPGFAQTLRDLVQDRATGGFEIGLGGLRDDADTFVKFGTAVGYLIGPANHDSMSNKYYARFVVQDTDGSDSYLRQAYRLFTLHTDGTFVDEATDWLLMMKFAEENARGGESRLLHLDDWSDLDTFTSSPLANREFVYKAPGSKNISEEVERPLFFNCDHGLSVSFIDQFVQPRDVEEALFLRDFSQSIEQSPGTHELPLPVGNMVVINNYFWMHGRAAFEKDANLHRELLRLRGTFSA